MNEKDAEAWGPAIKAYLTYLRAANKSEGTIRQYEHKLVDMAERVDVGPGAVTLAMVSELLARPSWGVQTMKNAEVGLRRVLPVGDARPAGGPTIRRSTSRGCTCRSRCPGRPRSP